MKLNVYGDNSKLWQWDTGRRLTVEDAGGCDRVYFGRKGMDSAPVVPIREEDGLLLADIPNSMLLGSGNFTVYLYLYEENGTQTRYEQTFYVNPCPKPDAYVYTETEVLNYASLDERMSTLEGEGLSAAVEAYLQENPAQDGKTPVKGVDYFTDEEVQQIAEMAAGYVSVPSDGEWKKLVDVTTTEEVHSLEYAFEEVKDIIAMFYCQLTETSTNNRYHTIYLNGKNVSEINRFYNNNYRGMAFRLTYTGYCAVGVSSTEEEFMPVNNSRTGSAKARYLNSLITDTGATKIKVSPNSADDNYMAGARLLVIGR